MAIANVIPKLNTVVLRPNYRRPVAQAYTFLKNIETVEINRVEVIDNVPYFVIEIYTTVRSSQIPTVSQRKRATVQQSLWRVRESTNDPATRGARDPDFIIKRSFAAFLEFQNEICSHLEAETRGNCHTCNAWMTFTAFAMTKSTLTMILLPLKAVRRRELSRFLKAAVLLAIKATVPAAQRQQCFVSDTIALSTSRFLQDGVAGF
jgi:hypothetical protein